MRYVDMCSLTTCSAFALALWYGNGRPANAPCLSVVMVTGTSLSEFGVSASDSSSEGETGAAPGDGDSEWS